MATARKLAQFRVELDEAGETATIHIEDEAGETLEFRAERAQLDVIADTLDDLLAETEEADEA